MLGKLRALKVGQLAAVTFVTGGHELTRDLLVVATTRASVSLRSKEFAGVWRVKFADVGSEGPHANRVVAL